MLVLFSFSVQTRYTGGYGGIGRRAGFRYQWATVQVQVLLSAVIKRLSINLIYRKSFNF